MISSLLALVPGPLLLLLAALVGGSRMQMVTRIGALLAWAQLGISVLCCGRYLGNTTGSALVAQGFRLDTTAALFIILTTLVVSSALTHAVGFFAREMAEGHKVTRGMRQFYIFTPLFLLSMYAVVSADNLGFLWISVEATTLLSAPLVYYHRSRTALEATWKYLIICSVGIAFAFFGTAVLYAASQHVPALSEGVLSLAKLTATARLLPSGLLRLGFVFILLGYGTKAGLFPLHSWLPDAHSEAPAPASAMLSGALLNCALVALWRTSSLMAAAGEQHLVQMTLLPMGILTVLAASLFLIKQRDLKRLLAYSSMENVGLMGVAIALGTSSGFALQALNHSLVKVALFLLAGNLLQQYGTKTIRQIRGALAALPSQGALLLLAIVAVAGTPPFGSFLAEWQILSVAADHGHLAVVVILSVALAVAFIALSVQAVGMVYGEPSPENAVTPAPRRAALSLIATPGLLLATALYLGVALTPTAMALARGVGR